MLTVQDSIANSYARMVPKRGARSPKKEFRLWGDWYRMTFRNGDPFRVYRKWGSTWVRISDPIGKKAYAEWIHETIEKRASRNTEG